MSWLAVCFLNKIIQLKYLRPLLLYFFHREEKKEKKFSLLFSITFYKLLY